MTHPELKKTLKKSMDPESFQSLAAVCPGLSSDPLSLAFLSSPESLLLLSKYEVIKKVSKVIPVFFQRFG